jgi:hypothetical protein
VEPGLVLAPERVRAKALTSKAWSESVFQFGLRPSFQACC